MVWTLERFEMRLFKISNTGIINLDMPIQSLILKCKDTYNPFGHTFRRYCLYLNGECIYSLEDGNEMREIFDRLCAELAK
jgi:hypothetical protein